MMQIMSVDCTASEENVFILFFLIILLEKLRRHLCVSISERCLCVRGLGVVVGESDCTEVELLSLLLGGVALLHTY